MIDGNEPADPEDVAALVALVVDTARDATAMAFIHGDPLILDMARRLIEFSEAITPSTQHIKDHT